MKSITRLTVLLAFLGFAAVSAFAVPRAVILEEFTNASCGPCASQNPFFKKYINNHYSQVIPVIYHASFPGADRMYDWDKAMSNARQAYYGVNDIGVPVVFTNGAVHTKSYATGGYNGAPGDTVGLASRVTPQLALETPVTLNVTASIDENYKMSIHVGVSSTEALNNKVIRVVLVEGYHYYLDSKGSNGETDFFFIARKMFPSASGTPLTLEAGASESYDYTYDIPEELYHKTLYVVAFVQDDATKEVLQSARSSAPDVHNAANEPKVMAKLVSTDHYIQVEKSSTTNYEYLLQNESDEDMTFSIKVGENYSLIPQGWTFNIEPATILIPAGQTKPFTVEVTAPNAVTSALFTVQMDPVGRTQGYASTSLGRSFYMSEGVKYLNMYGGTDYSVVNINNVLSLEKYGPTAAWMPVDFEALRKFPAENFDVVVFPANYRNYLGAVYADENLAKEWIAWIKKGMDNGTHFWLTGDLPVNLAYDQSFINLDVQNFFKEYFGIGKGGFGAAYNNGYLQVPLKGNANDALTKDFTYNLNSELSSQWPLPTYFFEWVTITNPNIASPILYYSNPSGDVIAGAKIERTLTDNTKGRAIYMGFNPEVIRNSTVREPLYSSIMDWLVNGNVSVVEINGGSLNLTVGPNPAVENANVRLELNGVASSQAEVFVIDMSGKRVATLHNGMIAQGMNEFNLNSSRLANGSYFAIVNIDGKTLATPFNVVK